MATAEMGGGKLRDALATAEADARRAIALAPGLGQPYSALAFVLQSKLDLSGASQAYDRAYAASPGDALVLRTRGDFLSLFGNAEAITLYQRSEALDPLRTRNAANRADMQFNLGRFDDAIASARGFLAQNAGDPGASKSLGFSLLARGRPAEALRAVGAIDPDDYGRLTIVAAANATIDRPASDRALSTLVLKYGDVAQYQIAEVHAWRREPDLAFAAIQRAWDGLDPGLIQFKTDPMLAPIRSDPRYGDWLRKIGFV